MFKIYKENIHWPYIKLVKVELLVDKKTFSEEYLYMQGYNMAE